MRRSKPDLKDRERLVDYVFNQGKTVAAAASLLDVKKRTAYSILNRFEKENRIELKKQSGRKPTFDENFEKKLIEFFERKPDATLVECQRSIERDPEHYGAAVPSIATIERILKKNRWTLKTLSPIPVARNSPRTIASREIYVSRLLDIEGAYEQKSIIYIDEMGRNLHCRRRFGRSLIGAPAIIEVPTQQGNNLSIAAAINCNGVVHYKSKFLSFKGSDFAEFLDELFQQLASVDKMVFIMDNAAIHHSSDVKSWFQVHRDRVRAFYLPPYSPFLNPIEECFSKIHYKIAQARPDTNNTLMMSVKDAFAAVTAENCRGWFSHSRQYHRCCLRKEPVLKKANGSCPEFRLLEDEGDESEIDELLMC